MTLCGSSMSRLLAHPSATVPVVFHLLKLSCLSQIDFASPLHEFLQEGSGMRGLIQSAMNNGNGHYVNQEFALPSSSSNMAGNTFSTAHHGTHRTALELFIAKQ